MATCALRYLLHNIYQSVLYFQNVSGLRGTRVNVISFMPKRKEGADYQETHKCSTSQYTEHVQSILAKSNNKRLKSG
jgi:hypothetical protein